VRQAKKTIFGGTENRYYLTGTLSNNDAWEFGHIFKYYNSRIVLDFADVGVGSGKPQELYWGSIHRKGTKDFQAGDKVMLVWSGGVKGEFPDNAVVSIIPSSTSAVSASDKMMEAIKIVPNPYLVAHEAQRGAPELYFNYLPEECTIRIYTVALNLVKTLYHLGGSRERWDMQSEGGQLVASQLLYAYIEAPNGAKTVKRFSVVVGK
jgi:hypothetical protein